LSALRNFEEWEEDPHYIWDSLFQEIDIETNELLFQWRASDHYSMDENSTTTWYLRATLTP
jgi:hypothetical protein